MNDNSIADIFSFESIAGNVGAPFLVGMAVGYFAKKTLKIALFVAGAALVLLFAAEYYHVISINNDAVLDVAGKAGNAMKDSGGFLVERLKLISARGVSAVGGFYAGFKIG
jgi:uncharacterized membrane protein (Fun14 family)